MDTPKPIGYWVKHLDNLLERQFQAALEDRDLTRRHWQVLNVLYGGARSSEELEESLAPFWVDDGPDLETILHGDGGLSPRGWIRRSELLVGLSNDGYDAYQKIAARVEETRETILHGLSAEEYAETIRVLSVMASNIERALRPPLT
ncbi:MarR family winged helix-turn-helix transcriptional regulator [Glycomyces tarimensis]